MTADAARPAGPDPKEVRAFLRAWAVAQPWRSSVDLVAGWVGSVGALVAMRWALDAGVWAALLPLELLYGLATIKLFLLQHDGGHGCAWRGRRANAIFALLAGIPANTTPSVWKADHDRHHAHSNDLDHPQDGQTASWTVAEFDAAHPVARWAYALATSPPVLFTFGPYVLFFGRMRVLARWYENLAQAVWFLALWKAGLLGLHLVAFGPVGAFGFLVFHAQHTFDGVYKARGAAYDAVTNSRYGSSRLVLPRVGPLDGVLRWFFHGVAFHDLHHLHTAIPGHRLDACATASGTWFADAPHVTLGDAVRTAHWNLWDEDAGRFDVALRRLLAPGRPTGSPPTPSSPASRPPDPSAR